MNLIIYLHNFILLKKIKTKTSQMNKISTQETTVLSLLDNAVMLNATKTALIYEGERISFKQLEITSNQLSNYLKQKGIFNYCELPHLGHNLAVTGIDDLQLIQFFFESWLASRLIVISTGRNVGSLSCSGSGNRY